MTTDALALLDGAATVLRGIAPNLSGDAKYAALLAANAVATARRDVALAEPSAAARAALPRDSEAIRSGAHDGDAALYDRILAHAALRAWIADPASLTEAERAAHVEGAHAEGTRDGGVRDGGVRVEEARVGEARVGEARVGGAQIEGGPG